MSIEPILEDGAEDVDLGGMILAGFLEGSLLSEVVAFLESQFFQEIFLLEADFLEESSISSIGDED
jgi:hypothetical protein